MAGRPNEWAGQRGRRLILDMNALRARMGLSKRKAIHQLNTQPPCTIGPARGAGSAGRRISSHTARDACPRRAFLGGGGG
jgi:hypothetical protein